MRRIIAWWSGGIASAVACKLALDEFSDDFNVEIVFIDTKNEHDDTYRFLKDCESVYGKEIKVISSDKWESIEQVWRTRLSLNVAGGAVCSSELKKRVRVEYQDLENDFAQIFGFDYDKNEQKRARNMLKNFPEINPFFPLIEMKYTKQKCISKVKSWGVKIPEMYELGFRNNNCFKTGCVQGGIGYWKKIQKEFPEKYERMAKLEHELSEAKGKPVTICYDEIGGKARIRRLLFLLHNPNMPDVPDLSIKSGREVEPLTECNGFCSTDEQIDLFGEIISDIQRIRNVEL